MILGVDTGGTFTDFVLLDENRMCVHKVLSTPDNPARAIMQGMQELGIGLEGLHVVHGSTVATNAVLEGKLARTVFITNRGLKDMLTIGRQARRELYNLTPAPVVPPVPEALCLEVAGRLSAQGELLEPFDADDDETLRKQLAALKPDAVAINLLFSFIDSAPEEHIESLVADEIFVTRSSSLLSVYREYERGMTTWLNAATGPVIKNYLHRLLEQVYPASLTVMQSSGDTIDAEQAAVKSAHLLLSGPAGGLLGAQSIAASAGFDRLMTFDMGGTSTDVALIDGDIRLTQEGTIAGYPVSVPMVDMHTIGAGGGSLAWLDDGRLLHVGPQSAGAAPGPACYGKGGKQPTVTDAHVVLGRLPAQAALGGTMSLDHDAARHAVGSIADHLQCEVEAAANGIIELANEHMAAALRVISVEKGHDPGDFVLVSFGGAGGLHVCDLADQLGMKHAIVPTNAGVLSAYGMLVAPRGRQYIQTFVQPILLFNRQRAEQRFNNMQAIGIASLKAEGIDEMQLQIQRQVDMRYIGQSSTLRVDWCDTQMMAQDFHTQHEQRFGHSLDEPLELVNLHCSVQSQASPIGLPKAGNEEAPPAGEHIVHGCESAVPVYDRQLLGAGQALAGPALVIEESATTWIKPGWQATPDQFRNLILAR